MTVATTATKQQTTGDGVTVAFPFSFGFDLNASIKVILSEIATGVETIQTEGAQYTLAGVGTDAGIVTMSVAPAATQRVTIYLDPDPTQSTNFRIGDAFPSDALEEALDLSIRVNQRAKHVNPRGLQIKESDLDDASSQYDAKSRRITDLADGVDLQDAVTATQLAAAVFGSLASLTLTGTLDVAGNTVLGGTLGVGGDPGGNDFLITRAENFTGGVLVPSNNSLSWAWNAGFDAAQVITLQLSDRGSQQWAIIKDASNNFILQNDAILSTITIENTAEADSLYIDADGHIGFGADPGANQFLVNDGSNDILSIATSSILNAIQIDGTGIGFFDTAPAAQPAVYARVAVVVEDRILLASAGATTLNNNNVLAALIADLQSLGLIG